MVYLLCSQFFFAAPKWSRKTVIAGVKRQANNIVVKIGNRVNFNATMNHAAYSIWQCVERKTFEVLHHSPLTKEGLW